MVGEVIAANGVSFKYAPDEADVLSNISFAIEQGEWIALIGPNGSGKSTLAKIMNGLLAPHSGTIQVKGETLNEETVWNVRQSVGMVFQNPDNQFVGATVEDDVAFGMENLGVPRPEMIERVEHALEEVNMQAYKQHEPAKLSGGQKQRVALAGIIALRPDVIIMDEATAMLDPMGRYEVIEAIERLKERYNLTVISITHDLDEAAEADRIFVMNQGQLVKIAPPEEIFLMGEELMGMGLDVPFSQKLQKALSTRGFAVPETYLDEEDLLQWLSKLYSKM